MPNTAGTPQTNIRLTPEDRAKVERIGQATGLQTTASVIRYALAQTARAIDPPPAAAPRKNPKNRAVGT